MAKRITFVNARISIHAPREGGDLINNHIRQLRQISIHAPREGGDVSVSRKPLPSVLFQSTPPARGATDSNKAAYRAFRISIHAPREGGDATRCSSGQTASISIHAPREGGDDEEWYRLRHWISIHAPREGGDVVKR